MDEDRELLLSFSAGPGAAETGALKGRRRDKSPVALKKRLTRSGPRPRDGLRHRARGCLRRPCHGAGQHRLPPFRSGGRSPV